MRSIYQRCLLKVNRLLKMNRQGNLRSFDLYLPYVKDKWGLEIGGPSDVFRKGNPTPVYEEARRVDNCDFSKTNVWAKHSASFVFNPEKPAGTSLFCEAPS
jgi:hypothetical protein